METSDRARFATAISAMSSAFGREADEAMLEGYWLGLDDLSIGEVEGACRRALRGSEFMPKPFELRQMAGHMAPGSRAVLAWDAVMSAMKQVGSWSSVDFDDPIVNATVRSMGGWMQLCSKPLEELQTWSRKEFERVYSALCEHGASVEACAALSGGHEQQAVRNGYEIAGVRKVPCGLPPHKSNIVRHLSSGSADIGGIVKALAEKKSA